MVELPEGRTFDSAEVPAGLATKESLGLVAPEGFNHALTV
jgi:hypothetical protein